LAADGKLLFKHLFSFIDHNASVDTLLKYVGKETAAVS